MTVGVVRENGRGYQYRRVLSKLTGLMNMDLYRRKQEEAKE